MRAEAAVVVVGGGIIGCSIAYHLTARPAAATSSSSRRAT